MAKEILDKDSKTEVVTPHICPYKYKPEEEDPELCTCKETCAFGSGSHFFYKEIVMLEHRIIEGRYVIKETIMGWSSTSVRWITNTEVHPNRKEKVDQLRTMEAADPYNHMVYVTGDASVRGDGIMEDHPEWRKGCPYCATLTK